MESDPVKKHLREFLLRHGVRFGEDTEKFQCPFHGDGKEKTPSANFMPDSDEAVFHCFGCNESFDIYRAAAEFIGVPCDKENFREIAAYIARTLGLPEWRPPKRSGRAKTPPGWKLSRSEVYRPELLQGCAKALDSGDMEHAYRQAHLLFALFMLPEAGPEPPRPPYTLKEITKGYMIRRRHG
jgi:hypothetical protein